MNVDYSAYEGKTIKGVVETVLSRGKVVIENGEYKGKAGDGQFLKRGTCGTFSRLLKIKEFDQEPIQSTRHTRGHEITPIKPYFFRVLRAGSFNFVDRNHFSAACQESHC